MTIRPTTAAGACLAAAVFVGTAVAPAQAADALGTWFTGDKESQVRIVNCGGALCGNLVWLKEPNGPNQWSGEVYNASDGKTYSGSFTLTGPNTADLKGCVLSILCKSQTWTRAN